VQCPVCGAEHDGAACPVHPGAFAPGTVIADRYEIRALLGRGGMGTVYRAFDRILDEEVALKVQLAEAARGTGAERRFRTEVKLARQVSHSNVCRLHDGGQQGTLRWISMELVEGETLAARLRDGPLAEAGAWDAVLQAAEGLAAVHRAGIVHRDLKPANLMVDRAGRVRLMDFGIARGAASGETATGGYAQGSPEYMSPEQARGRPADVRSDVYAFGVVIFELFTGRVPFRAETPVATLLQHLEARPPLEHVPAPLRALVGRALAKDPRERFPDGAALADALRAARAGRAAPVPPPERRWPFGAAVALLAVGVIAAVLAFRGPGRREVGPTPSPKLSPERSGISPAVPPPASPSPNVGPTATPRATLSSPTPPAPRPAPVRATAEPTSRGATAHAGPAPAVPSTPPATPIPTPMPEPALGGVEEAPPVTPREGEAPPVEDGALLVVVRPWADISVDGIPRGQTPLAAIPLAPGPHRVLLTHPDYRPYPRRVVVEPGQTLRLVVDLRTDGVRRR
jgi:serine/threonine protein kinase